MINEALHRVLAVQDRLVKELSLQNINTIEEANKYLPKYIKAHNDKFAVPPEESEDKHRATTKNLDEILCWKTERTISKNLEINYETKVLQIKENPTRTMQKSRATVIETLSGEIKIIYQGKELKYQELETKWSQGKVRDKKRLLNQSAA